MTISAHDFSEKSAGSGISFGAGLAEFVNALRQLADRIEGGEVLAQSATVRSRARIDELTTTHIMLVVFEKVPAPESAGIGGMQINDRREEFKHVPWQQGFVIKTRTTERWSDERLTEVNALEKCTAYAFFQLSDQGRGRKYVYQFSSSKECAAAVEAHNKALKEASSATERA